MNKQSNAKVEKRQNNQRADVGFSHTSFGKGLVVEP